MKSFEGKPAARPFDASNLSDPTVIFTLAVISVPLIDCDFWRAVSYIFSPTFILSLVYLKVIEYVTFSDTSRSEGKKLTQKEQIVANWFLMNGVYYNLFLDVISGQFQLWNEMSRQYLLVEPRYQFGIFSDAGAPVFMTSMCELFFQSPLCVLAYYYYCTSHGDAKRNRRARDILALLVSVLHAAGVWWFYIPEAVAAFPHLGGWPAISEVFSFQKLLYFWFGFWFCGILWLVVPFHIGKQAIINLIFEEDAEPNTKLHPKAK